MTNSSTIRADALREAAAAAMSLLSKEADDLAGIADDYITAASTGTLNGRKITFETAKNTAHDFWERSHAVSQCAEYVTAAILALIPTDATDEVARQREENDRLQKHIAKQSQDIITLGHMAGRTIVAEAELATLRARLEQVEGALREAREPIQAKAWEERNNPHATWWAETLAVIDAALAPARDKGATDATPGDHHD